MIKIKSRTDVITNSSDETYIWRSTEDPVELRKDLLEYLGPDHEHTGMGGILDVWSSDGRGYLEYPGAYKDFPEGYLVIDMDNGYREDLLDYLIEFLGKPLTSEEIDEIYKPIHEAKYKEYSEKLLDPKIPISEKSEKIWLHWLSYRRSVKATDTGYLGVLKKIRAWYLSEIQGYKEKLKETKDRSEKRVLKNRIEFFSTEILPYIEKIIEKGKI